MYMRTFTRDFYIAKGKLVTQIFNQICCVAIFCIDYSCQSSMFQSDIRYRINVIYNPYFFKKG